MTNNQRLALALLQRHHTVLHSRSWLAARMREAGASRTTPRGAERAVEALVEEGLAECEPHPIAGLGYRASIAGLAIKLRKAMAS